MPKFIDLKGNVYSRLTVIERTENKGIHTAWLCRCSCGNITKATGGNLKNGDIKSCGCLKRSLGCKLVKTNRRTYLSWKGMFQRCDNPNHKDYNDYGGRGIIICDRWYKFENFLEDMGNRPKGMTIDRINNDGNYEPSNCKWSTLTEQARNKRNSVYLTYKGETLSGAAMAEKYKINRHTLWYRIYQGWSIERAIETPVGG